MLVNAMWEKLVPSTGRRVSLAMLILRVTVGIAFVLHGMPKLAHPLSWDSGHGPLPGVPGWLQLIVVLAETVGGWCVVFGFLTPLFAFLQACDMVVVTFVIKMANGLPYVGPQGRSYEVEAHLLAGALVLLLCGPGAYSLDAAIKTMAARRARFS
jgi:putative oxidoreductase